MKKLSITAFITYPSTSNQTRFSNEVDNNVNDTFLRPEVDHRPLTTIVDDNNDPDYNPSLLDQNVSCVSEREGNLNLTRPTAEQSKTVSKYIKRETNVTMLMKMIGRSRGPDEFWRKRRIFRLAAHYIGRRRNCYSITIRSVHRALVYATQGRKLKKHDITELRDARITAGCEQHGLSYKDLREGLTRSNILLNRKSISDLAAWEPHSFKALTDIAKEKLSEDGLITVTNLQPPVDVITRGMLKE